MNDITTQAKPSPMVAFKRDLEVVVAREMEMLDDKAKSRMKNAMIVAATKDPEILSADRASVFMAARMCASHGVIPDGIEATIQIYSTKAKGADGQERWIKKATYLPMIRGIQNRVERSGKVRLFTAEVVYEGETFTIDTTHGDRRPVHVFDPMRRGSDAQIIGAYSTALMHDGTVDCEAMPLAEIMKVRSVAKTKAVWDGWFSEKSKVSVMKRHSKRLPLSAEDMDFIQARDETDFEPPRDVTPPEPKVPLSQRLREPVREAEPTVFGDGLARHWTVIIDTQNAFPGDPAWDEGVAAAQAGAARETCPYDADPDGAAHWLGGFDGAKEAAK